MSNEIPSAPNKIRLLIRDSTFDDRWYFTDAAVRKYDAEIIYVRERQWWPIESAPRDKSILLGAQGLEGWIQMSGYRTNADWYFIGGGWMGVEPTHWIPLPNPPGSVPSGEVKDR
jgi:hypothetical protein